MRIRVVIADDHRILREGLAAILNRRGVRVIGQASNGEEAIQMARELEPHILLMDLEMPVLDGNEATRQIKSLHPSCRVIMLTVHDYPSARVAAHQSGADAFIVKGAPVESIVQTISKRKE